MRKRRFAFGAIVLALFVGVACQSPSGSPTESGATGFDACGAQDAGDAFQIGGVTDVGDLEDKSFNEAGWCGTLAGNDSVGGTAEVVVTESAEDYDANIQTLVDEGFNIIVTYGFALGNATLDMAIANPEVNFIGLDQFYCIDAEGNRDTEPADAPDCDGNGDFAELVPNAQGLIFAEAQPGYLAGVLACSISETGVIGAVGGIFAVPPVPQYIGGYHNGCLSVNPDATVLVEYVSEDIAVAFNDPDTGRQLADQMVEADADVLFQVAGGSGQGVLSAACDNDLYAIGVDVDQFNSSPDHQACLVTSAEKKIIAAITAAIERVADGSAVGGNISNDATNGGIGLAPYHNFEDLITDDIQGAIDEALAGLADGSIDPCAGPGECFFDPD
jgi:basic membrane protein A